MAKLVLLMGESGTGKSASMRNLDCETTFYIDADKKGLPWRGWREMYNRERKNYLRSSDVSLIKRCLFHIDSGIPAIETVVIDTLSSIMLEIEMQRMREKGFEKWQEFACEIYHLIETCAKLRDDLSVVFVGHTKTIETGRGEYLTCLKTQGKKLDSVRLESKFFAVLLAKCKNGSFLFETAARNSTAKSPLYAFDRFEIENDMQTVLDALQLF